MNKYQAMLLDINNTCNLRCRFCINTWSEHKNHVYMDSDTFNKALSLLSLVDRGFMSCAFEPTIHPNFIEYFSRIPKRTGAYTFITTNLSRSLTDEELIAMSKFNLDAITVSIGSFRPEIYEELHKGSNLDILIHNLKRLSVICRGSSNAPDLRFITVILKQNIGELELIAKIINDCYSPIMHQFRTPFQHTTNIKTKEWLKKSMISREEWKEAEAKLKALNYKHIEFFNPLYPDKPVKQSDTYFTTPKEVTNTYFSFRADGTITFHESDKKLLPMRFRKNFNINDLDNPYKFFKSKLKEIK